MNPLGILVAAWIFLALARLPAARKPLFFAALSVPVAALVVPFGAYPLAALAAAAVGSAVTEIPCFQRCDVFPFHNRILQKLMILYITFSL